MAKFGRVVFRRDDFRDNVDLRIAGNFVGVMSCGKAPRDVDLFMLVDRMKTT